MSLTTRPLTPAPPHDLGDADFAELDELLAATPQPLEPLDVVMLDGYLCGVLVQPVLLEAAAWLPHVFDIDGQPLPDDAEPAWLQRCTALIMRRHAALNRALAEDGWFEPLVLEIDDDEQDEDEAGDEAADDGDDDEAQADDAQAEDEAADEDALEDDAVDDVPPVSRPLTPWVIGFEHACGTFPDLLEQGDENNLAAVSIIYRHLPIVNDAQREVLAELEPLATLDDAIEELVLAVADIHERTEPQRYRVETVRRETPKVGRNEPCPCGSGKKYKACHGA